MTDPLSRRGFLLRSGAASLAGCLGQVSRSAEPPVVPTVDAHIKKLAADAPLAMEFRGRTADECRKWQSEFATKLRGLLGPHSPPAKWTTHVERVVELKDHVRHELILEAEDHPLLPVYMLTPTKGDGKRPGVLALHGHGAHGYDPVAGCDDKPGVDKAIEGANYDYGRQFVRRGYVVAVPCFTPFGRRLGKAEDYGKQDACGITFIRMQLLGKVLMAENLRDALWSLELLARHERVDAKRLACVGLSYGGRMTMLTSALEPRIRVGVVSGALNVMQERVSGKYSCGAQVIPGLLPLGDVPEIASLIAPRTCVWEVGSRDGLMIPKWVDASLERIGRAYRAFDAADQLQVDRFDGGHRWNGAVAFPLMEKVLG